MSTFLQAVEGEFDYNIVVEHSAQGSRVTIGTPYPLLKGSHAGKEITYARYGGMPALTGFPSPLFDKPRLTASAIELVQRLPHYFGIQRLMVTEKRLVFITPADEKSVAFMFTQMFRFTVSSQEAAAA